MRIRSRAPQNELRAAQNSLRAARNSLRAARNIPHRRTEYSVRLCGIFRSPVREYSVRLNLNMTKTLAFLIKKVNFAFFERVCTKLDSKPQPSDYKSDAIPLDQGGFVGKNAVLQVLYYVRAESMKLLPRRHCLSWPAAYLVF